MTAGKADLTIEQGATFSVVASLTDSSGAVFPLAGYTAAAAMKDKFSTSVPVASFTCAINTTLGTITLTMSAATTTAIPVTEVTRYVWDLKITSAGGVATRVLQGLISVSPEVTV